MSNNTTAENTTGDNMTALETAEETGILDTLLDMLGANPEALAVVGITAAAGTTAYYKVPQVRELADKYLPMVYIRMALSKLFRRHGAQIDALIEANLTKVQAAAFKKLDAAAQKHVKDNVLRNVILSTYDQYDDAMTKQVQTDVRAALTAARGG